MLTAREVGEQLDQLAQRAADPTHCLQAHEALGLTLFHMGDYATARLHLEQGIALTDPATQRAQALRLGLAPVVTCLVYAANLLWCLGYPSQAIGRSQEALAHPHSLGWPTPIAWRWPSTGQPSCFTGAVWCRPSRRRLRLSWP